MVDITKMAIFASYSSHIAVQLAYFQIANIGISMKLTIEIQAYHNKEGKLEMDCCGKQLGTIDSGVKDVFIHDASTYDTQRNYITEQAEVLESLYRYIRNIVSHYNGRQNYPQFPQSLIPNRQKDTTCSDS